MIEELEYEYIYHNIAYSPSQDEIIAKINEIIRYLNEKEEQNG